MVNRRQLETYVNSARGRFEDLLGQMVEVPSISMDPSRAGDLRKMAELAVQYLTDLGAEARIVETGGYPIVCGGWTTGPGHPTVTVYNHMDVQPAQEPEWTQAPFAFANDNGLYRGRGATDDKGPALAALLGARFAVDQGWPINVRFLWELEEEIGSPHFSQGLKDRTAIPRPDSVVVSDTIWIAKGRPAMPYGLRGLLGARLMLRTGSKDAHSGLTGGAARNPLAELMEVAQSCVDAKTGKVKIPGFYDDVVEPTKAEIKSFLASGFNVKRFKQAYGFQSLRTNDPSDIMRRIWARPTFEIHGLTGGYQGPGVKTVVPGQGELKVSMRLVPNQTPEKAFALLKKHVAKVNPSVTVEREGMLQPFKGWFDGPYVDAVKRAAQAGFGKQPAFIREGGSIGAVVTMQKAWKVPILFLGLSLPEHGYHAPNEYFDWGQASGGMKAFAHYFAELAKMGKT
ncbi:M20/M25/M40 family metallo-hydrolase [Nitrospira moscoviensis]|uniref:Putative Peptidase M20 n=1 Tax=Nitrospira moscoviensis TaxID=42253 RepID=A0A0K2GJ51_NITMO|nr:M20/M25/M40 family metallo-hydrolase [Nitrospira moscoviensis]ALA60965.1 putative Peptidase M20 [Nitrospira moscoviensis]